MNRPAHLSLVLFLTITIFNGSCADENGQNGTTTSDALESIVMPIENASQTDGNDMRNSTLSSDVALNDTNGEENDRLKRWGGYGYGGCGCRTYGYGGGYGYGYGRGYGYGQRGGGYGTRYGYNRYGYGGYYRNRGYGYGGYRARGYGTYNGYGRGYGYGGGGAYNSGGYGNGGGAAAAPLFLDWTAPRTGVSPPGANGPYGPFGVGLAGILQGVLFGG